LCIPCTQRFLNHHSRCTACSYVPELHEISKKMCTRCRGGTWLFMRVAISDELQQKLNKFAEAEEAPDTPSSTMIDTATKSPKQTEQQIEDTSEMIVTETTSPTVPAVTSENAQDTVTEESTSLVTTLGVPSPKPVSPSMSASTTGTHDAASAPASPTHSLAKSDTISTDTITTTSDSSLLFGLGPKDTPLIKAHSTPATAPTTQASDCTTPLALQTSQPQATSDAELISLQANKSPTLTVTAASVSSLSPSIVHTPDV
jgi:hypothetical protein